MTLVRKLKCVTQFGERFTSVYIYFVTNVCCMPGQPNARITKAFMTVISLDTFYWRHIRLHCQHLFPPCSFYRYMPIHASYTYLTYAILCHHVNVDQTLGSFLWGKSFDGNTRLWLIFQRYEPLFIFLTRLALVTNNLAIYNASVFVTKIGRVLVATYFFWYKGPIVIFQKHSNVCRTNLCPDKNVHAVTPVSFPVAKWLNHSPFTSKTAGSFLRRVYLM